MSFPRKYWARNTRTGEVLRSFFSFSERFRERFKQIGCRTISFSSEGANGCFKDERIETDLL